MNEGTGRVGIVTVTHNSAQVLPDFLDSLAAQVYADLRVYAIDSGSRDDTVAMLRREERLATLIVRPSSENIGIAEGNNRGIRQAIEDGCEWVLLLNNDTKFPPSLVEHLVATARDAELDLLSPLIEAAEPVGTIWYAGGHINAWQSFRTVHERAGAPLARAPQGLISTGFASACCLLVRCSVFAKVGLMNPLLFVYFDDVEFAVRANRAGLAFWYTSGVRMLHKASSLTGGAESDFSTSWSSRNWPLLGRIYSSGMTRLTGVLYIRAWMLARRVLGRDSASRYRVRRNALQEAYALPWRSAPRV